MPLQWTLDYHRRNKRHPAWVLLMREGVAKHNAGGNFDNVGRNTTALSFPFHCTYYHTLQKALLFSSTSLGGPGFRYDSMGSGVGHDGMGHGMSMRYDIYIIATTGIETL